MIDLQDLRKIQWSGSGLTGNYARYTRTQWTGVERIEKLSAGFAKVGIVATPEQTGESREAFDVAQDLGRHIVLVQPAD